MIWNDGFVQISWFTGTGTSSTGQELDIDFTIDRLGKAVEKKAEYDSYVKSLDSNYDDVKQIWNKLSAEIDKLYGKLEEKIPQAKDTTYEFDTGLFEQYRDAFREEINALNEQK